MTCLRTFNGNCFCFYWCQITFETDINILPMSFLCSGELTNISEAQKQVSKYYSFHNIFYHQGKITGVNGPI